VSSFLTDLLASLRHPCKFQWLSRLGALLHGTLVVCVSQTAALNRGHHLSSAGRPSRWALAHVLVYVWNDLSYLLKTRRQAAQIWRVLMQELPTSSMTVPTQPPTHDRNWTPLSTHLATAWPFDSTAVAKAVMRKYTYCDM